MNIAGKGMMNSCRSNNDVGNHRFNRSPDHRNASPISVGVCQPVLSGNNYKDRKLGGKRDSSVGRFSYLRSVGNAVLNDSEVRKSVDRIRISKVNLHEEKNDADLVADLKTRFEEEGRRGTTPNEIAPKTGGMSFFKRNLDGPADSTGKNSHSELFAGRNDINNQQRSKTSYGA